ncbi:phosphonate metabolism transcriptional regulator PhnF [Marivivens sp.]|jgi:GntR family phosphonate transport system transcriptional regulator|uniref:phosphonate metabolism transcriptional regulator PhnF n=1 Tax=Marivivens sp. TaxID=1978374 RepID=UPI00201F0D0C|nr:phosphonate metabolism transcriptional regulator PhnF [Marivivens sp.]MCL7407367.1 phosphonate metabolism transcriptional regulator PhnF [Marivivens geojensis]NBT51691.1 phosphonate metabolism transcriptional regulator PhnF [Marivivens sp.]NCW67886.1 phosphonate metabolism transcriptional regulator PhnF [Marivivens sp.]
MTRKNPVWLSIAQTLKDEIGEGLYPAGTKLPTEAQLSARFGVNRHTVRHALASLNEDGITVSQRGSGVFVASNPPADYQLGARVRFHQNIAATGRAPSRQVIRIETRPAKAEERDALGVDMVHVVEGISSGDALPICHFISALPAQRFADLPQIMETERSISKTLERLGVTDYTRHSTRITATIAKGPRAGMLKVSEGSPLLRTEAINVDCDGAPIEYGLSWFVGDRVALTVANDGH